MYKFFTAKSVPFTVVSALTPAPYTEFIIRLQRSPVCGGKQGCIKFWCKNTGGTESFETTRDSRTGQQIKI